jgi:two-component system sensor histidine kinase SenX3
VEVIATAALTALVGAAVGLAAGLAFRASERSQRREAPVDRPPVVPEGVDQVLAVLRASALVIDDALTVVKASPSAVVFGLVRGDRVVVPDLLDLASAVLHDGQIREAQLEMPRSNDRTQTLYVATRAAPLGPNLVLVLAEDRTHAIRSDEVRRDFVANVSHELKTPVGALTLLAEAVQEASDDPDAVNRFATRMQKEGARLTRLVQEIIDLSRLQYDDPVESPDVVDVDDVIAGALDRCRVDAEVRDLQLAAGGHAGLQVFGDEEQLVVALGNLVENAISYSPTHTRVAIGVRRRSDQVEITVTDQGPGIREADLDRVFERFYRGDPARSRATGGTGLGLAIVKHIAASHGGDVTVWSVEGAGSTFTLRLPLHAAKQTAVAPYSSGSTGSSGSTATTEEAPS